MGIPSAASSASRQASRDVHPPRICAGVNQSRVSQATASADDQHRRHVQERELDIGHVDGARIDIDRGHMEVPLIVDALRAHRLGDRHLADPRLSIEMADIHDVIVRDVERFDAILLDVDNGPDGLIHLANERLYCNWGLRAAHAARRPGVSRRGKRNAHNLARGKKIRPPCRSRLNRLNHAEPKDARNHDQGSR
ncbi:hypothetical protein [Sphingomonas oryzagri]